MTALQLKLRNGTTCHLTSLGMRRAAKFLRWEIHTRQRYLHAGFELRPTDNVVDVGGNLGRFVGSGGPAGPAWPGRDHRADAAGIFLSSAKYREKSPRQRYRFARGGRLRRRQNRHGDLSGHRGAVARCPYSPSDDGPRARKMATLVGAADGPANFPRPGHGRATACNRELSEARLRGRRI